VYRALNVYRAKLTYREAKMIATIEAKTIPVARGFFHYQEISKTTFFSFPFNERLTLKRR